MMQAIIYALLVAIAALNLAIAWLVADAARALVVELQAFRQAIGVKPPAMEHRPVVSIRIPVRRPRGPELN